MSRTGEVTGSPAARPVTYVERVSSHQTSFIDVLDRVLDKGMVIDGWWRFSIGGIDLVSVEARVVVASIHTYVHFSDAVAEAKLVARTLGEASSEHALAESLVATRRPPPRARGSTPPAGARSSSVATHLRRRPRR
jgi:hypothetical protein